MAGKTGRSQGHRCFRPMPLCFFKDRLFACSSDVKSKDELNSKKIWLKYNMRVFFFFKEFEREFIESVEH